MGRDLWRSIIQSPAESKALRALSTKSRTSTTDTSPLLQDLVPEFNHPHGIFFPLICGQGFSCSNLCLLPLLLSQCTFRKSLTHAPALATSVALLDLLLYATVFMLGSPNQTPCTQSHKCCAEGEDPFLRPAGCTPANTARDTVSLCCLGSLLTPGQVFVYPDPQGLVFFAKLLIKQSAPSLYHCKGLLHPRCRPSH